MTTAVLKTAGKDCQNMWSVEPTTALWSVIVAGATSSTIGEHMIGYS